MATKKTQARRKATSGAKKPKTTKSTTAKKTSAQAKSTGEKTKKARKTTVAKAKTKTAAKKAGSSKTLQTIVEKKSIVQPAGIAPSPKKPTPKRTKTLASAAKLTKKFTVQVKKKPKTKPVNTVAEKTSQANPSQSKTTKRLPVETLSSERRIEEVGKLAYYKWEAAGCPVGDGVDFWFAAETEFDRERPS